MHSGLVGTIGGGVSVIFSAFFLRGGGGGAPVSHEETEKYWCRAWGKEVRVHKAHILLCTHISSSFCRADVTLVERNLNSMAVNNFVNGGPFG